MGDRREITTVLEREARDDRSIARIASVSEPGRCELRKISATRWGKLLFDKAPGLLVIVQKSIGLINKQRRAVFFDDAKN